MKALFYIVILLALFSCKKNENDPIEETGFHYVPRTCSYAIASHYYRTDMGAETGNSEFDDTYYVQPLTGSSIKTADYLLSINIGSFNRKMAAQPDFIPENYVGEADLNMEQQIEQFLQHTRSNSLKQASTPQLNIVDVEYRKEELKAIKISSTTNMFDVNAGNSLNDHIEIFGTPFYHNFVFSYDKQLIGSIQRGWTIKQYLNYRPMAPAFMYLRFTSAPSEALPETRFVIEMEMAGGEILRDTTDVVKLLP
nr:hypothetical protein [uncultured Draconibacterium sp.]